MMLEIGSPISVTKEERCEDIKTSLVVPVDVSNGFSTQQAFLNQLSAVWYNCSILPTQEFWKFGMFLTNEDIPNPNSKLSFADNFSGV